MLLTGDNDATARAVAAEVGVDEAIAEVLPAGKADVIRRLQDEGRVVAMVGDGVNDAPALAQADLGLAIGTHRCRDRSLRPDPISGDLRAAADAIRLSRRTLATIKGNLFWAFAYNVVLVPVAIRSQFGRRWSSPWLARRTALGLMAPTTSNRLRSGATSVP